MALHQKTSICHFHKNTKTSKSTKWKSEKSWKCVKKHQKKGGSNFGLKTGSRGTPWNRKNAGPGGSDFTKCRFWSFKWHFGLFQGGVNFWCFFHFFTFLISHFSDFCIFWFCHFFTFLHFIDFLIFCIFWFWSIFVTFLCWWWILINFCV